MASCKQTTGDTIFLSVFKQKFSSYSNLVPTNV